MNALLPLFVIASVFSVLHKCSGEIPSDIQKCHAGDVLCIAKTTNDILRRNPNGNKRLGLQKLEPIHLDELVVAKTHGNTPLRLDLKFTDLNVYGLSKANVTRVVGFKKDPCKSKFEVYATIPLLTLRGQYEAKGRILLLPVNGKGPANVQLTNFKSGVKVKVTTTDENCKLRIAVSKIKVHNEPELMTVQLDNLFSGDSALGDELNNVINSNWKDIWSELESGINDGYTQIIRLLISDVLNAITYDEFFSN